MLDRRYELLLAVHLSLGREGEASEIARLRFHHNRQEETLSNLLDLIGEDQRQAVLDEAASRFLTAPELDLDDLSFLIDQSRIGNVESYLESRQNKARPEVLVLEQVWRFRQRSVGRPQSLDPWRESPSGR